MDRSRMNSNSTYLLCKGVQVRPEKFGLLFYHYKGPKLYFAPSAELFDADFFRGRQALGDLIAALRQVHKQPQEAIKKRLRTFLNLLASKGLIYEQPLC